jgi:4-amino-4-deoxy-L-arabinose transferase-like glycosyltransferase
MKSIESETRPSRWVPPDRFGHLVQWLLLVLSSGILLTNGYYLKFAEPTVSRRTLSLVVILLTALWIVTRRYGIPRTYAEIVAITRRHAALLLLGIILLVAFGLRLSGIAHGLPQSYVPDEYDYVHSYLVMIKRGDLNPHWWYHPSLQPYLNVATFLVVFFLQVPTGRWSSVHQLSVEDMLYWGRFGVGVVSGTATVLVTYLLGRKLFGTRIALMSAALLAVFPGAVEVSQYNKPDPLLTLMTALSVLVTLSYLAKGERKLAFAAGIVFGLTVATKYNGALVLLPFLLAVILRHGRRALFEADLYLGAAGSVIGFFVGCPYVIAELPKFFDHVADGLYTYGFTGREGAEGINNWFTHARYTINYGAGWWPFVAGLAGIALMLYRLDAKLAVFLTFPVIYYSYYSSQNINFPGNLIPVYPFLAILAAYGGYESAVWLSRLLKARVKFMSSFALEPYFVMVILILLLWFPVNMSLAYNRLVNLPDTGNIAREWIKGHFPPGTHFGVERHTPVLDPKRYRITQESRVINRGVANYRDEGVEYLITTEIAYKRFGPEHRQTRNYQKLFRICPLVKEFQPAEGRVGGPRIRILRVPPE